MKIVISTAVYYPMTNGVAVFSHNLAVGMVKRGHEVMVLCPSLTGKNHLEIQDGVQVMYLRSMEIPFYPDQIHPVPEKKQLFYKDGFHVSVFPELEIKRALDDFQPDVIHCQISDPIGLTVVRYAKKRHIPLVTTEHNYPEVITDPLKIPKEFKKPVNHLLAKFFVSRQKKSNYVTMPTQMAIDDLILKREKDFKVPVEAVSNGVDLASFKPGKANKSIYTRYNIPVGHPVALYVGRVDPEKQIGIVIEAFSKVLRKLPEALLVIVGDGVDRIRLENIAAELNISQNVLFLGRVLPPDLYELYKIGNVFVTASEIETQGIVLIEAAATGLPLVAVDKGAVKEVCQNKINGILCEPKDIDGIAKSVTRILQDPKLRQQYSEKSLAIAKNHDIGRTMAKFEDIYLSLIKEYQHL